jgi:5-carboxymethyl-2-hydroxymuconate isomerase
MPVPKLIGMTLAALASTPAPARTTQAPKAAIVPAAIVPSPSVRAEIVRAEDDWRAARIAGDTAFLERFYAAEGRIQAMDGKVQSRAADIALFATGRIKPRFIRHGPLDIAVYGTPPS